MIRLSCGTTPRGEHVALEHLGIAAEAGDPLLDARAAAVVEADHRRADLHRRVHHLADLLRVALRQRAAEHGEILGEDIDQPAVDRARSGDHAVAGDLLLLHAEVDAIMLDVHVDFFEAAGIEQHATIARARSAAPWHAARRSASPRRRAARPARRFSSSSIVVAMTSPWPPRCHAEPERQRPEAPPCREAMGRGTARRAVEGPVGGGARPLHRSAMLSGPPPHAFSAGRKIRRQLR